jgi:hypothetical protein
MQHGRRQMFYLDCFQEVAHLSMRFGEENRDEGDLLLSQRITITCCHVVDRLNP